MFLKNYIHIQLNPKKKKKSQEYIAKKSKRCLAGKRKMDRFIIICNYSSFLYFLLILGR